MTWGVYHMTINQILKLNISDISQLSEKELRGIVSQMRKIANNRLVTLSKRKLKTETVKQLMRSGGKISTKGKDLNALKSEFFRAKAFLKNPASKVIGAKKEIARTNEGIKKISEKIDASVEETADILELYEKAVDIDPSLGANARAYKYKLLEYLSESANDKNKSIEQIAVELKARLDELYEEGVRNDVDEISEFFEM